MKLKKLLASILAVAMILSTMSFTAFAADGDVAMIGETPYATLQLAIDEAQPGDVIVLCNDVERIPTITKAITIDGNGYHVTGKADEYQFAVIDGMVTLKNLVYDNGTEAIRTDYGNYGGASAAYENLNLVIENCIFNNLTGYAIMCGTVNAKTHGSLTVKECTFNANEETGCNNFMVWAQQVGKLTVTDCTFNGNGVTKGAIHTGDSTTVATVANISGGTINGTEIGVQTANRFDGTSISVDGVTFNNIDAITDGNKTGAIFIYSYATQPVSATGNTFVDCENVISTNNTTDGFIGTIVETFEDNKNGDDNDLELNEDGTVTVVPVFALNRVEAENNMTEDDLSAQVILITFNNVPCVDENMTVYLYYNDELLSTTDIAAKRLGQAYEALTANVVYSGDAAISGSWTTEINAPWTIDRAPNKIVVDIDGDKTTFEIDEIAAFSKFEKFDLTAGSITPGYTNNKGVWGEGGANAKESFVVELYAEDKKIAQTSLNDYEDIIDGDLYVTWNIKFNGEDSEYWTVDWYDNNPSVDTVPTKVVLVVDGVKVAENVVKMCSPDDLNPVKWDELEGIPVAARIGKTGYSSLEAAATAAEALAAGDTEVVIELLEDITLDTGIQFHNSKNITINGNNHKITMVHNPDDNNYSNPHEATERPTGFSISDEKNYSEEPGSVFNIKNMTIVNNKGLGYYKNGHSWRASYNSYAYAEIANYTNVNFIGGVSVAQNASFVDCTFTEDRTDMFMVFADQEYSKAGESFEISFDNCEFNYAGNAYGTVKVANDNGTFAVEVKNSTFNNCANKPAINTDTNITAIIENNLFNNCVAGAFNADSGTVNGVDVTSEEATAAINDVNTVIATEMTVGFVEVKPGLYNIVITAADDIYEFVGAELTFDNDSLTDGNEYMNYEILGIDGTTNAEKSIEKADTYALRLVDGADRMSGRDLVIGQVKFYGQGDINFTVAEGKVVTTQYGTNLGQYYTLDADETTTDTLSVNGITNGAVEEVTRTVVVNVAYNHALDGTYWSDNQITVTLKDGFGNVYDAEDLTNGVATINNVRLGRLTVTLEAPGFRKYVYNTTLEAGANEDDALVLNFWNDIKRNTVQSPLAEIEAGVSGKTDKNFVVGDIVMDYTVDEYDLAAVTSYYGMYELTDADKYIKYDLNRDGNIDIIDVHYVLHTLGN